MAWMRSRRGSGGRARSGSTPAAPCRRGHDPRRSARRSGPARVGSGGDRVRRPPGRPPRREVLDRPVVDVGRRDPQGRLVARPAARRAVVRDRDTARGRRAVVLAALVEHSLGDGRAEAVGGRAKYDPATTSGCWRRPLATIEPIGEARHDHPAGASTSTSAATSSAQSTSVNSSDWIPRPCQRWSSVTHPVVADSGSIEGNHVSSPVQPTIRQQHHRRRVRRRPRRVGHVGAAPRPGRSTIRLGEAGVGTSKRRLRAARGETGVTELLALDGHAVL